MAAPKKSKVIEVTMPKVRDTKGTHVYAVDEGSDSPVRNVYIQKSGINQLGDDVPEAVVVTVRAAG